jgi:CTP synthase (UTP-ammonia lyase)
MMIRVALVGDFDPDVLAHTAISVALRLAAGAIGVEVAPEWVGTAEIGSEARLEGHHAIWCVPASPYRSMEGALRAIRFARERGIPFLGTCGGFQHAVVEYARNVLGWADADHAETSPGAGRAVIAPLECSLVEVRGAISLLPGSRLQGAYGRERIEEGYHCRYGLNPAFREALTAGPLRAAALDDAGEVRAVELDGHPFFVATLFQPERGALTGEVPPPVAGLLRGAVG